MTDGGNTASPGRSLPAKAPAPPAPPLIAPTGTPGLNSVIDVVNATAAPFMQAPSTEHGAAGAVATVLNAVTGLVGAPEKIVHDAAQLAVPPEAIRPWLGSL